MHLQPERAKYVIVSPFRDEEKYIETTIQAVLSQTVRPYKWVLVDDGSIHKSPTLVDRYAAKHDWISVLAYARDGERQPGTAVIRAFNAGFELFRNAGFEFIVKLDCDLDLPPDYFERMVERFHQDAALGIASGIYLEQRHGNWFPVPMPEYHAAGAAKMVRAKCFEDIGGFVPSRGWDSLDEIRAQMAGWKTRHFRELTFRHLRTEGTGIGHVRTNVMHGEIYYLTGGSMPFFFLKFLHRLVFGKPLVYAGLALLWGFLKPWFSGKERLVSEVEARFYRRLLNRRITARLMRAFGRSKPVEKILSRT